jgi:hypothetical protein
MKKTLLFILLLSVTSAAVSQQSDFVVIKKRNNRTLKTYFQGAFISAVTYNGFPINGFIKDIRNDSIIIHQETRELRATDFGSELDTVAYTMGVDYREIKQFNFSDKYTWGRKKGFATVTLPLIMMIGGAGYIVLELANTGYRNDSLKDQKKLLSLGVAGAVAATGFLIKQLQKHNEKVGGKYKVVYVKVNSIK